jgi:hypothetical protein
VFKIDLILDRFPERRDEIQRRFSQDAVFREICEDYAEISKTLADLGEAGEPLVAGTIEQYRDLLRELETEIVWALDRDQVPPGANRHNKPRERR